MTSVCRWTKIMAIDLLFYYLKCFLRVRALIKSLNLLENKNKSEMSSNSNPILWELKKWYRFFQNKIQTFKPGIFIFKERSVSLARTQYIFNTGFSIKCQKNEISSVMQDEQCTRSTNKYCRYCKLISS